jgi:hypothetical protein
MGHAGSGPMIGRSVVVAAYLVALAVAGRPVWLAVLLGVALVLVWVAPLVLDPSRHSSAALHRRRRPEGGPA